MAVATIVSDTLPMAFDPAARLRLGDASAWPRYRPEHLPTHEVWDAWTSAASHLGEPGVPPTLRVYTHFAYCESTCNFCMYFHEVPRELDAHVRYVDYLVRAVERFHRAAGRARVSSVYFGGGTPSATPTAELARYLSAFRSVFDVAGEFSFEAHPRSMDAEKVELVHSHGVNRISMGVQSLEPAVLREITRKNAPLAAIAELVSTARALNITVNLDLVLGLPGQTMDSFRADMARIAEIGPDVVTLYRYQPVPKLPHETPAEMHYHQAFSDDVLKSIECWGYRIADPVEDDSSTVRLLRRDLNRTIAAAQTYALFDDEPSHLVGFGPGAYGHAFGYGWFREVTSMERLEEPTYWGTRLSPLDECRQILLDALANRKSWDFAALQRTTGVDVEADFAEPLGWARSAGVMTSRGTRAEFGELSEDLRRRLIEALMPAAPSHSPGAPPPSFQRELVTLRNPRRDDTGDRELVRAWCDAIGVPERGRRLFGAIVRDWDDRSVYFAVRGSGGVPLRVLVRHPGTGRAFHETSRFAISYAARPEQQLSQEEQAFLEQIVRAMRQLDETPTPDRS